LNEAPSPPRNYSQGLELAVGTSPRELPWHCTYKAGNLQLFPLHICGVDLLLLRKRRGVADNGLGTTAMYLRRATSGAANSDLGTTNQYLRRTTSGAASNGLSATIKNLQQTMSGAAGNGLCRKISSYSSSGGSKLSKYM
jgi:hypothetical protein